MHQPSNLEVSSAHPWSQKLTMEEQLEYAPLVVYAWLSVTFAAMLTWTKTALPLTPTTCTVMAACAMLGIAFAGSLFRIVSTGSGRWRRTCAPLTAFFGGTTHLLLMMVPNAEIGHEATVVFVVMLDVVVCGMLTALIIRNNVASSHDAPEQA